MTLQLIAAIAFVVPALLLAILHRTRAFWVGGFVPSVAGVTLFVNGAMLGIIVGVGLVVYGFVLLSIGAHLFKRHVQAREGRP